MISRYRRLYARDQRLAHDAKTPHMDDSHVTQRLPQAQSVPPHTRLVHNVVQDNAIGQIAADADNTEFRGNVLDVREPDEFARLAQQACLPLGIVENQSTPLASFPPRTNLSEVPSCNF